MLLIMLGHRLKQYCTDKEGILATLSIRQTQLNSLLTWDWVAKWRLIEGEIYNMLYMPIHSVCESGFNFKVLERLPHKALEKLRE